MAEKLKCRLSGGFETQKGASGVRRAHPRARRGALHLILP
jgi:hypothetical protein